MCNRLGQFWAEYSYTLNSRYDLNCVESAVKLQSANQPADSSRSRDIIVGLLI